MGYGQQVVDFKQNPSPCNSKYIRVTDSVNCLIVIQPIIQCQQQKDSNLNITSAACAVGPNVIMSSTDFSFQNVGSWNLFEIEITLKISISPTF
jgi:hypothetical protein